VKEYRSDEVKLCHHYKLENNIFQVKKWLILWKFSGLISLENDRFCIDLTNAFNQKKWQFFQFFFGK